MLSLQQVVGSEATSNEGLFRVIWHATCLQQPRTPKQDNGANGTWMGFGTHLPSKYLKLLPPSLLTVCKCAGKCANCQCGCRAAGGSCAVFCHGKMEKSSWKNHPVKTHPTCMHVHLEYTLREIRLYGALLVNLI